MSDPTKLPDEAPRRAIPPEESLRDHRLDDTWLGTYTPDSYPAPPYEQRPVKQERLFPRRVLIGWGLAAFTFWFLVRVIGPLIAPLVANSVKETLTHRTTIPTPGAHSRR